MTNKSIHTICLVGPAQVGKTRVVYKCLNARRPTLSYMPTVALETHPYMFYSDNQRYTATLYDVAGVHKLMGPVDTYMSQADFCVIYCPTNLQASHLSFWSSLAMRNNIDYVVATDDNSVISAIQKYIINAMQN